MFSLLLLFSLVGAAHVHFDCEPKVASTERMADPRGIYGRLLPKSEPDTGDIGLKYIQQCFYGAGFTDCSHMNGIERLDVANDVASDMASSPFHWRATFRNSDDSGMMWCLQCCSNTRLSIEMNSSWSLSCDYSNEQAVACGGVMPVGMAENFRNYEFRFNNKPRGSEAEMIDNQVKCDLERKGGTIENNETSSDSSSGARNDTLAPTPTPANEQGLVLVGYRLEVIVKEYTMGVDAFVGVDSCKAVGIETADKDRIAEKRFEEHITLVVQAGPRTSASFLWLAALPLSLLFSYHLGLQ